MKKFKVIIVPSSDDEHKFENATTFAQARKVMKDKEILASMYRFDTLKERDAFIAGYESAIGYLGNGLFYTSKK